MMKILLGVMLLILALYTFVVSTDTFDFVDFISEFIDNIHILIVLIIVVGMIYGGFALICGALNLK